MSHHDEVVVQSRSVVRIEKGKTVPRLRDSELQGIYRERGSVAFIFPQIIRPKVGENKDSAQYGDDRERPVGVEPRRG